MRTCTIYVYIYRARLYAMGTMRAVWRGKRCESHVSLFLLLSDNRNCIHITQSRGGSCIRTGAWISRARFPKRATSTKSRKHPRHVRRRSVSVLRLTHFCRDVSHREIRPRPVTTLLQRHTATCIIFAGIAKGDRVRRLSVICADWIDRDDAGQ